MQLEIQKYSRGYLIRKSLIGRQIRSNKINRSHVKFVKMAEKHEFDERIKKQIEADNIRAEEDRKLKLRLQEEKERMEKEESEEEKRILEARKDRIFKKKILEYQKKRLIINRKNSAMKIQKWWRFQLRIVQYLMIVTHNLCVISYAS